MSGLQSRPDHGWRVSALPVPPESAPDLAETLLLSCGGRSVLHVGCGSGEIVRALLRQGVEARGMDLLTPALDGLASRMPGCFMACDGFLRLPVADGTQDVVLVTLSLAGSDEAALDAFFVELRRVAVRAVHALVDVSGSELTREHIEARAFAAGFRKHPAYYQVNAYEALQHEGGRLTILLEPMSDEQLARYPLTALREERDLHMDMLREPGARSDAHVARYQWALSFVRPGDRVLDAACGLGYGSYLLQACSAARSTLGVDGSAYALDYATTCFASRLPGLSFQQGFLPDALDGIEDGSIDLVVSFETLEHVEHNERLLAEFHRILSPGGRLVASVPNDWSDETGKDPNPFHLHVYTLEMLRGQMSRHFVLERLAAQSASRHKSGPGRHEWIPAERRLREVAVDVLVDEAPEAEWWLAVAMRSPLDTANVKYRESIFPSPAGRAWNVTAFERDYRNPWLVQGMVHVHHRLQERNELSALSNAVARNADLGSPDQGAALCVQAYLQLGSDTLAAADVADIEARISAYLEAPPQTPQGVRWHISLLFVLGRLWMTVGDFARARAALEACVRLDPLKYSPLLGNRSVEAYLLLGILCHVALQRDAAQVYWRSGIAEARRVLTADWAEALGDVDQPAEFGLPELASVLEYASSCAMALVGLDDADRKCGWWRRPLHNRLVEIARLNRANARMMQASAWHASQHDQWERRARGIEVRLGELDELAQRLGGDKAWLLDQRDALAREAASQGARVAVLDSELEKALADLKWIEGQRDAWEARARDFERQVVGLEKEAVEATKGREWLDGQRVAWETQAAGLSEELARIAVVLERCQSDYSWISGERDEQADRAEQAERRAAALDGELARLRRTVEQKDALLLAAEGCQAHLQCDIAWHDEQRGRWEQKAAEAERRVRELEGRLQECLVAVEWNAAERAAWEGRAQGAEGRVAELERELQRFSENADKIQEEMSSMQAHQLQQDKRIAAINSELEFQRESLDRIRSRRLIRLLNLFFRNRYY